MEAAGGGARALRHGAAGDGAGRCGRTARAPPPAAGTEPTRRIWIVFYFLMGDSLFFSAHATHKDANFRRPDAGARGGRKKGATAEREDAAARRQQGARTHGPRAKPLNDGHRPTATNHRSPEQTKLSPTFFLRPPASRHSPFLPPMACARFFFVPHPERQSCSPASGFQIHCLGAPRMVVVTAFLSSSPSPFTAS